jgi:hypothetical protein
MPKTVFSTGAIEAVRSPFWHIFDSMRGRRAVDMFERKDTSHSLPVPFAACALVAMVVNTALPRSLWRVRPDLAR